jgi:hypothetical protein
MVNASLAARWAANRAILAPIIHEFPGRQEKSKEFLTEVTETMPRDHREIPEMFSVNSVVKWFKETNTLITL